MLSGWVFTPLQRTAIGTERSSSVTLNRNHLKKKNPKTNLPAAKLVWTVEVGLAQSLPLSVTRGEAKPTKPL